MTNLMKSQKFKIPFCGTDVEIAIRIPSAVESEEIIEKGMKHSEIFSRFVISVCCPGIADFENIKPADVLALPGTYSLVQKTAIHICTAASIPEVVNV